MNKRRFLATKLVRSLLTIWIIVTLSFLALHLSGDPIDALVGDQAPAEVADYYRAKFGLDRPLPEQYVNYFVNIAQGDFGLSLSNRVPATQMVLQTLPKTLELGFTAFLIGLGMGIVLGVLAAVNRNTAIDRFVMGFAVFGFSIPNFFLGILLILLFAMKLRILPAAGSDSPLHLILPAITLGTSFAGTFARFTRSAMVEMLNRPFMTAARARGVPSFMRVYAHALPNAAIPIITIVGLKLGDLVAGSVVTETVFAWPGVGRLLITSVTSRDFAVVQAILIMVAVTMILANLLVDVLYTVIDPRTRASVKGR